MTLPATYRARHSWALVAVIVFAWLLRCTPLLMGPFHFPLDYDEGVHYASAALWQQGIMPYRDFVFVHPPGYLWAQWPLVALNFEPSQGLALGRWAMTLVGSLNVGLLWLLARRCWGPTSAVAAAFCYAIYPEVVSAERRMLLEPLLNTCVLSLLLSTRCRWAAWWAGLGLSIKAWGALWLVAWSIVAPLRRWKLTLLFLAFALLVTTVVCGSLAWTGPGEFFHQTVLFHLARPRVSSYVLWVRLGHIFDFWHLPITLLALIGWLDRGRTRHPVASCLSWGWGLLLLALIAAPVHFEQYNTHLALPECFWAGHGLRRLGRTFRPLLVLLAVPLAHTLSVLPMSDPVQLERATRVRAWLQPGQQVFSLDPCDTLMVDELPPHDEGAPVVVDSYGTMLLQDGGRHRVQSEAFRNPEAQLPVLRRMLDTDLLILGKRAEDQLSLPTRQLLQLRMRRRDGDLWQRR